MMKIKGYSLMSIVDFKYPLCWIGAGDDACTSYSHFPNS